MLLLTSFDHITLFGGYVGPISPKRLRVEELNHINKGDSTPSSQFLWKDRSVISVALLQVAELPPITKIGEIHFSSG